jgi:hypothetical protein
MMMMIAMAQAAFSKKKTLRTSKLDLNVRNKLIQLLNFEQR